MHLTVGWVRIITKGTRPNVQNFASQDSAGALENVSAQPCALKDSNAENCGDNQSTHGTPYVKLLAAGVTQEPPAWETQVARSIQEARRSRASIAGALSCAALPVELNSRTNMHPGEVKSISQ
mmetsp:Transcript_43668/g.79669  ORF Transcript_43668/g.79669 Transcript_43668/m.79669 type:complete len:123 (-) Transcript_43668:143-511(-)